MSGPRQRVAALPPDVRGAFHGGAINALTGGGDRGAVHTVVVGDPEGGDAVEVDADGKEIRVTASDGLMGEEFTATLVAPGSALWRKPPEGSIAVVLRPARLSGPGQPFLLHGDGGDAGDVPDKLDDTNTVLSPPTGDLVLESRDGTIDLFSATTTSKPVRANGDDFDALKTQDFLSELSTLLGDLVTELAKGTSGSPVAQQLVGLATITAKIAAFRLKLASTTTFRSQKLQHG